jgi:fructokinase
MFGAIEAGGTKFVCGTGSGPADLDTIQVPTTSPSETLRECLAYLASRKPLAVGIASFGPVNLKTGHITSTPKAGWEDFDIAGEVRRGLGVPVGFDTDVNGSAMGEARWGAARGLTDAIYLTVGTGIGGGAISGGRVVHGRQHPEMGHIRLPHNLAADPFPGVCPFHGDCFEGLASGPAMQARWGSPAHELPSGHPAWLLEAHYIALGLTALQCTLSPQRIILGGGVMNHEQIFPLIRLEIERLLNGYLAPCEIVPPGLGKRSGVLGALALAEQAAGVFARV